MRHPVAAGSFIASLRCFSSAIVAFMRSFGKRIEPLLQKLTVVEDLLLEVLALFAQGLTESSGGSKCALSHRQVPKSGR